MMGWLCGRRPDQWMPDTARRHGHRRANPQCQSEANDACCCARGPAIAGVETMLEAANHTATGCDVRAFARLLHKYTPAVCLCGVGNRLVGSTVHDGPHFGMLLTGNDHTIEDNHFHTLVQAGADAGAIYSGRDWTYRGQMIRRNVFENITSYLCHPGGCSNCAHQPPRALHSDDGMSGWR